ncbi:helix-turn-helix transcriptional regulator [Nonomuraea sp. K274]|uniref:Helix-turn-helix transcriptional regulator n=2 Tax=Nonomuraea cypriaca TaxID=1187855 RepID=A0A931A5J2_9ACTN|nr:helix-turn-helix transcriptional regulator [Nonomuraea cypriaca]
MLRALGHPVRLGIMRRLAARPETCACDFSDVFGLKQPTISQHLKVLREADLVTTRRRGNQICYSVHPDAILELTDTLGALAARPADATSRSGRTSGPGALDRVDRP